MRAEGFHNKELSYPKAKRAPTEKICAGRRRYTGFKEQRELATSGLWEDRAVAVMGAHKVQAFQGSEVTQKVAYDLLSLADLVFGQRQPEGGWFLFHVLQFNKKSLL